MKPFRTASTFRASGRTRRSPLATAPLAAAALAGSLFAQAGDRVPATPAANDGLKPPAQAEPVEPALDGARVLPAAPQALPAKGAEPDFARAPGFATARERVEYDEREEVGLWAHGGTYKAGFTADGAQYVPFLGSRAPDCYPLTMRVASASVGGTPLAFDAAAPPSREGDLVRYRRGAFDEVYELALGSIEQLFVFETLPPGASGDLVVRIATESAMTGRELAERIEFANDLGAVRYGRATALDADGDAVSAPTTLTEHGIEIRVPAAFLATAELPLTIDPVITTFTLDASPIDSFYADVAYDIGTARWLIVYEEIFSSVDRDIRYRLTTSGGISITNGYADGSLSQNWAEPAVACNRWWGNFLVVAQVGFYPNRVIQGRLITNAGSAVGSGIVLSTGDQGGDKVNPDVGGDPFVGQGYYCVVWEREFSSSDRDIHYRLLSPQGFLQGTTTLFADNTGSSVDVLPSISKSDDEATWNVVWQRSVNGQGDLRAARIRWDGLLTTDSFPIDTSLTSFTRPSASTSLDSTNRWVVACERDFGSDFDIHLFALDNATLLESVDLTGLEVALSGISTLLENQRRPDVDSDGTSFAVVYSETYQGSTVDTDIYVSGVSLIGTELQVSEIHQNLAFSGTAEDYPAIASRGFSGGGLKRYLTAWYDLVNPAAHADIEGGLYETPHFTSFCFPGFEGVEACPCGNAPWATGFGCNNSADTGGARLVGSGTPSSIADTMVLTSHGMPPTALAIFNQGQSALDAGVTFGQGVRCVTGNLKRLYVKTASGGTASAPGAGDPSVSARSAALGDPIAVATTRGYYVYYRDPVVLGGCPSGSTYNATQAIEALWVP